MHTPAHTGPQTETRLPGREGLLRISATGSMNLHVERRQMLQSPYNAHSSFPLHSHLLTFYRILTPYSLHPFLFPSPLTNTMPCTYSPLPSQPSFDLSTSFSLYAIPVFLPVLFFPLSLALFLVFSSSSHHAERLLALSPAATSSEFACCSSRLFLRGDTCVCSPPYCFI